MCNWRPGLLHLHYLSTLSRSCSIFSVWCQWLICILKICQGFTSHMIYEITDICFFLLKEKQINKCSFSAFISSLPSTFPSPSGICLSVAELSSICEVEMSRQHSRLKWGCGYAWEVAALTIPPMLPPLISWGSAKDLDDQGRREKRERGRALLPCTAQAWWRHWYSWYVMSFSWVLAGRDQGEHRGLPHASLSVLMAQWQILAVISLEHVFGLSVQQKTWRFHRGNAARALFWHCNKPKGYARIESFMY